MRRSVATRFPHVALPAVAHELDDLVKKAMPGLVRRGDIYEPATTRHSPGTASSGTILAPTALSEAGMRLRGSLRRHGALTLCTTPKRYVRTARDLAERFDVDTLDVAELLVTATRELAADNEIDWPFVLGVDAGPRSGSDWANLVGLVQEAVETRWAERLTTPRPLLIVNAGPLVRYGLGRLLAHLLDVGHAAPGRPLAAGRDARQPGGAAARGRARAARPQPLDHPALRRHHPRHRPDPARNRSVIDSALLVKDLKAQLKLLVTDLRARAEDGQRRVGRAAAAGVGRGPPPRAHRAPVDHVAGQRGRPGRGRLDHRDDVPAVLRGQRPARRRAAGRASRTGRLDRRAGGAHGAGRGEPDRLLPRQPHRQPAALAPAGLPGAGRPAGGQGAGRPGAQPGVDGADQPGVGDGAHRVLAAHRRLRRAGPRLHRPRPRHPVPRRPLPGPLRAREEDLRAAADPGVRRGVHPRPDADARAEGVRARGPEADRPDLRLGPLPARRLRPAPRASGPPRRRR